MKIIISLFILNISMCSNQNLEIHLFPLVGKWKVSEPGNEYMIEINSDSTVKMYSYNTPSELNMTITHIDSKTLQLSPAKIKSQFSAEDKAVVQTLKESNSTPLKFKYTLNEHKLTLTDETSKKETIAINCKSGVCDEQKEFFRNKGPQINLPYNTLQNEKINFDAEKDLILFIGKPSLMDAMTYGQNEKIWNGGRIIRTGEISFIVDRHLLESEKVFGSSRVMVFADSKTKMETISSLSEGLFNSGITKLFLAVKQNEDVSFSLELGFILFMTKALKDINSSKNISEWIIED